MFKGFTRFCDSFKPEDMPHSVSNYAVLVNGQFMSGHKYMGDAIIQAAARLLLPAFENNVTISCRDLKDLQA